MIDGQRGAGQWAPRPASENVLWRDGSEDKTKPQITQANRSLQITTSPFDYGDLDPDLADALRGQAGRIRERTKQTISAIIETGRDLLAVRVHLQRGQFLPWIKAECGFSKSTAYNFMNMAERFGDVEVPNFGNLNPSNLYRLAAKSTATEIVTTVIDRAKTEVITDEIVQAMINEDKGLKSEAKRKEEQNRKRRRRERSHRAAPTEEDARARNERERREAEDEAKQIAHQVIRGLGVGETGEVVRAIRGSSHAFMLFMVLEQLEAALEQAGTAP